ncbi:MAG TPA: RNA repair transcriptional activator RtcR [Thermoanaerobaculia bacterium]|nr:RNA repair transcriptional activator RtcR [Thermoanaerobaculia bacterium]
MNKKQVVIGLLGPTLDRGDGAGRWGEWRPTVSLFQHEDFLVDRLELLHAKKFTTLADVVSADILSVSPETELKRHVVELQDAWDFEEVFGSLHDFARAYPFDTDREDYFVHITTGTHVAQICLFLLTESRALPARLLQSSPPLRKTTRAIGSYQVIDLDLSRYDRIAARFQTEHKASLSFLKSGIETKNTAFNALIERIERVAVASRAPLLLTGPTGAGKSLLARRIYELKRTRRQVEGPLVEVNCATIRGDGAMSALFGHEKGAFTGAVEKRSGLLRAADGGMLFLDEVGELSADEQAMLLRAIEEKRFLPVGSDREVKSDFALIAGTNRDLAADVRDGRFREDLFARINLWTFRLPPLRERPEDIEPNLDYELRELVRKTGESVRFNREARERFLTFARSPESLWTANFRDLNAAVTRMATLATGGRITTALVDEEAERLVCHWRAGESPSASALVDVLGEKGATALDRFDAVQLADVVEVCRKSRSLSEAGRMLYAQSRREKRMPNDADRLRKYLARFGLAWKTLRAEVDEPA